MRKHWSYARLNAISRSYRERENERAYNLLQKLNIDVDRLEKVYPKSSWKARYNYALNKNSKFNKEENYEKN